MYLPTDTDSNDISQWLGLGVFWVIRPDGNKLPGRLVDVHISNPERVQVDLIYEDGSMETERVRREEVLTHWPLCGCVNIQVRNTYTALYVQRQPLRQWMRTFRTSAAHLQTIDDCSFPSYVHDFPPRLIWHIFFPYYPSNYNEALILIANSHLQNRAIALTPSVSVSAKGTEKPGFACYHSEAVAKIKEGNHLEPLTEEVEPILARIVEASKGDLKYD